MKSPIMHDAGTSAWFARFTGESRRQMKMIKLLMVKAKVISAMKNYILIKSNVAVMHRVDCEISFSFARFGAFTSRSAHSHTHFGFGDGSL